MCIRDSRVVEFSSGVMEGDEIVILNGPLMNQTGLIKKLDRHKRCLLYTSCASARSPTSPKSLCRSP